VEIGTARGQSACFVGLALKENGKGKNYAIDPHCKTAWNDEGPADTYEMARRNVNRLGLQDYVELVRAKSEDAARNWRMPIDVLFIDGDHGYEGVKRDWNLFSSFVQPFGVVIFHDTLWDLKPDSPFYRPDMGVPRFVEELRQQGFPVITFSKDFGVSIVQPVKKGIRLSRNCPQ
jgi:predicted O-methyltransferase YrrM